MDLASFIRLISEFSEAYNDYLRRLFKLGSGASFFPNGEQRLADFSFWYGAAIWEYYNRNKKWNVGTHIQLALLTAFYHQIFQELWAQTAGMIVEETARCFGHSIKAGSSVEDFAKELETILASAGDRHVPTIARLIAEYYP